MNEQGLTNDGILREVQVNDNFRSLFVVTEKTLVDQGKDVSRALRNRCLEIAIHFDESEPRDEALDKAPLSSPAFI